MARLLVTSALVLAGFLRPAAAEDRALLVGVSDYRLPIPSLPGVAHDLAAMKEAAVTMGFRASSVRIVTGDEATRQGILDAIATWLVEGTGPADRALIYYSGHGTRVKDQDGDEADGLDEALVPADAVKGVNGAQNILLDDDLGPLLERIRARRVLALIDACYSGTLMRALDSEAPPRLVLMGEEPPMAASRRDESAAILDPPVQPPLDTRIVLLSAATETQLARGTPRGGAFTEGVVRAVQGAAARREPLTANELRDAAATFIAETFAQRPQFIHTPTVDGNPRLAAEDLLPGGRAAQAEGAAWARLEQITRHARYGLTVSVSQGAYRVGEPITIAIDVPKDGYLNVIHIGAGEDAAAVLFPNRFQPDNAVKAGTRVRIPAADASFDLPAMLPAGLREQRTLVLAVLTTRPVDAFALGRGREVLRELSPAAARAFVAGVTAAGSGHGAGQFIAVIRP